MRSPELFKSVTGSSLKGQADPSLDTMEADDKKKLKHLEKLEANGFDVEVLKDKLLRKENVDTL